MRRLIQILGGGISLLLLTTTIPLFAHPYEFRAVGKDQDLGTTIGLYGDTYVNLLRDPLVDGFNEQVIPLFNKMAGRYAREYSFDFHTSITPSIVDDAGFRFFPVLTVKEFEETKTAPYLQSVRGAYFSDAGEPIGYANAYTLSDHYFGPRMRDIETYKHASEHLERRYRGLAIANALAQSAVNSECNQANWPDFNVAHKPHDNAHLTHRNHNLLSTLAMARALDIWDGPDGFVDRGSFSRVAAVADTIARMELHPEYSDISRQLAGSWLGVNNMEGQPGGVMTTHYGNFEANPILTPIGLLIMAREWPTISYRVGAELNMLKDFDVEYICNEMPDTTVAVTKLLADTFSAFENSVSQHAQDVDFRHRRGLVVSRQVKIKLPFYAAAAQGKTPEIYKGTFLEPTTWESSLFDSIGCEELPYADIQNGQSWSLDIAPFAVRCIKLTWEHEGAKPLNVSITVQNEGEDALKDLESFVMFQDFQHKVGALTQEFNVSPHNPSKSSSGVLNYFLATESKSPAEWEKNEKVSYIYLHNVAKNITDTRRLKFEMKFVSPNTRAQVAAVDLVKVGNGQAPSREVKAPIPPDALFTPASFDLETLEDDPDPKLKLSFSYAQGMEGLYSDLARAASDATTNVTDAGAMSEGQREDLLAERLSNLDSISQNMRDIQNRVLADNYKDSVVVIIEAPAPPFGFIGEISDVLISVNWSDADGRPYDAESIGPSDLAAATTAEKYLNNGKLKISEFSRELFIATFEGTLTDEPILPPMGPPVPHRDRVVTGKAKGTIVISGLPLQRAAGMEIDVEFSEEEMLGGSDQIARLTKLPFGDAFDPAGPRSRSDAMAGGSGGGASPVALTCDCSCDAYWDGGVVSRPCLRRCETDYLMCREQQSQPSDGRMETHAEAIEFYWKMMGVQTPEQKQLSTEKIINLTPANFEALLDGIELMGGPKREGGGP
ncbi:MAG: hypothetical protein AAGF57_11890 [Pseudomonadota bacterium]